MEGRITSEEIVIVKDNEVFVFGSNEGGRHGLGAAKTALGFGAKWGQAAGLQGRTYGIPTKDKTIRRILTIDEIKTYVDDFIQFAIDNPQLTFLVTQIGCGLAGYKPKQIAPLFEKAVSVSNIHLPATFWHKLIKTNTEDRSIN